MVGLRAGKAIGDWIHVSDNPEINATDSATASIMAGVTTLKSLNFRTTFDVYATPKMFLLDRNKKVIAKQVGAEQIGKSSPARRPCAQRNNLFPLQNSCLA